MIKKRDNCLYCGDKMESKTAKKKFCSSKCRIYYKREKARGTLYVGKVDEIISSVNNVQPAMVTERKQHNHSLTLTVKPIVNIDETAINERIAILRKEIAHPPSKLMFPERVYKSVREKEIKELESKLK